MESAVRALVLEPLGMTRTGLTPDEDTRAHGYQIHPYARTATAEPVIDLRATAPSGDCGPPSPTWDVMPPSAPTPGASTCWPRRPCTR